MKKTNNASKPKKGSSVIMIILYTCSEVLSSATGQPLQPFVKLMVVHIGQRHTCAPLYSVNVIVRRKVRSVIVRLAIVSRVKSVPVHNLNHLFASCLIESYCSHWMKATEHACVIVRCRSSNLPCICTEFGNSHSHIITQRRMCVVTENVCKVWPALMPLSWYRSWHYTVAGIVSLCPHSKL